MQAELRVPNHSLSESSYIRYLNSLIPECYHYDISEDTDKDLSSTTLLYVTPDGTVLSAEVDVDAGDTMTWNQTLQKMHEDDANSDEEHPIDYYDIPQEPTIDQDVVQKTYYTFLDEWQETDRLTTGMFINPRKQILDIIRIKTPYAIGIAEKSKNPEALLFEPELEQLKKADYVIANTILNGAVTPRDARIFCSLTTRGSDIQHIFTVPAKIYKNLKNEENLSSWAAYKSIEFRVTNEEIQKLVQEHMGKNEINIIDNLIGYASLDKILNYTKRVMKEHPDEYRYRSWCLRELSHALNMSSYLGLSYNFKRYNLRKQHDKLAKLVRENYDKKFNEGIQNTYNAWKLYSKRTEKFIIRPVKNQKELNDEAESMENCVDSYAGNISKGKQVVFLLRKADDPNQSYITVEINPETGVIKQAFAFANKEIEDIDAICFLRHWEANTFKKLNKADIREQDRIVKFDGRDFERIYHQGINNDDEYEDLEEWDLADEDDENEDNLNPEERAVRNRAERNRQIDEQRQTLRQRTF